MTDAEFIAGDSDVAAPVAAAVVGQDPLDRDAVAGVEPPRSPEERRRRGRCLIGQLPGVGQTAVVVDREVDPVPAWAAAVIVQPDRTRAARSARPSGVRRALGLAIEGSSLAVACNTSSRG
jgi:hypothetical protein